MRINAGQRICVLWSAMILSMIWTIFITKSSIPQLNEGTKVEYIKSHFDENTQWCILSRQTLSMKYNFDHFPHALENILPCWSYFRRKEAVQNCGFILVNDLKLDKYGKDSWQNQLVREMKCNVMELRSDFPLTPPWNSSNVHMVNLLMKEPRYGTKRYMDKPEDAHALRRLFISDSDILKHKGEDKKLQIGMIQREHTRVITNIERIQLALQTALPDADIVTSTLHNFSLKEQAKWFATKDVIIAAHGAALMNSVFITPNTIVLQLYPNKYFYQSIEPLIEQTGGIALDWYYGIKENRNPHVEWLLAKKLNQQNYARASNIEAPVDEVVDLILIALGKKLMVWNDKRGTNIMEEFDDLMEQNKKLRNELKLLNYQINEVKKTNMDLNEDNEILNHKLSTFLQMINKQLDEQQSESVEINEIESKHDDKADVEKDKIHPKLKNKNKNKKKKKKFKELQKKLDTSTKIGE